MACESKQLKKYIKNKSSNHNGADKLASEFHGEPNTHQ